MKKRKSEMSNKKKMRLIIDHLLNKKFTGDTFPKELIFGTSI